MEIPDFKKYFEDPLETFIKKDDFLKSIPRKVDENIDLIKRRVYIDETVEIKTPIRIEGPVYIGPNCKIGPFSYIRSGTYLEGYNHVGNSEIKNSLILEGSNMPHFNYVGDSIIGRNCNFGAGAKTANLRLDEGYIRLNGEKTGRKKLGVVMGDNVKIGINVCLYPGEIIESNSFVYIDLKAQRKVIKKG